MSIDPPVLMPMWMPVIAVCGLLVVAAWLIGSLLSTRRDHSLRVGDVPMAPDERSQWVGKVDAAQAAYRSGTLDLRHLHLELAGVLRGFASARSGVDLSSATVMEILDAADTTGPRSVLARLLSVRRAGHPLDTNPLGHVGELLAVWEQPSFDREPASVAEKSLEQARAVVTRW